MDESWIGLKKILVFVGVSLVNFYHKLVHFYDPPFKVDKKFV